MPSTTAHRVATTVLVTLFAAIAPALTGCGSGARARTGFIPRSVTMIEVDDMTEQWRSSFDLSEYSSVIVAEVKTPNTGAYGDLDAAKLAEVRGILQKTLSDEVKDLGTAGAGCRTLVVHAAITAIKPNNPLLNVAPQTQILKRGYGYASCEMYATDGADGRILAAFMQTSDTQRLSTEKYSDTGTAERASKDWAKAFRKLIGG